MARDRDTDAPSGEPTAPEPERLLVDLLYGELDEDEAGAARQRIDEDEKLSGQLAALTSVRKVLGELPEEDPPAAVSARLLHAAATEGPSRSRAREPGLLPRLWRALARYLSPRSPGLYAFATVILVVGVAGLLHLRGARSVADDARPRQTAPAAEPAPAPPPADPAREAEVEEGGDDSATSGDPVPGGGGEATGTASASASEERSRKRRPTSSSKSSSGRGAARQQGAGVKGSGGAPEPPADKAPTKKAPAKKKEAADRTSAEKAPSRRPANKAPAQEPAAPEAPSAGVGDYLDLGTEEADLKEDAPDDRSGRDEDASRVRKLHQQALEAADKDDCAAVERLGQQIRRLDRRYHDRTFAPDPPIRRCRDGAAGE